MTCDDLRWSFLAEVDRAMRVYRNNFLAVRQVASLDWAGLVREHT